ncbi:hypothetical protein BDB00DRAFT_846286 [Zychaea mexicana]|uniref:uncharacterized protein n=1 Tax=Zychaea mexicana TaxID=64656 RepID=UPI0022FF2642|nr:uncharacterized protein BDB00DRAFT_846286 [Zychaea mexicana]KAI9488819.1 hypothetical protein BDB00DRAFT_846286 [Zychaea mexicana]
MPPRDPAIAAQSVQTPTENVQDKLLDHSMQDHWKAEMPGSPKTLYNREELLSYAKCFVYDSNDTAPIALISRAIQWIKSVPSALVRYGVLLPIRLASLSAATIAFFVSLPIAVTLESKSMVSTLVKYYCKGILFSLGTIPRYLGNKPCLSEPHVFVANHTSYLDYILVSACRFPNAVVMARHGGALGFLQNNGLNFLHSMTFDRSNTEERKDLAGRLRKHVMNPTTWPNPMIIFPEGTCVNNKYSIRFQKGAFELGVKVCPVGIKYDRYWGDPYWDTRKGFLYYAFYRMTRWITPVDVVYCTPQDLRPEEDAVQYGERIKAVISDTIGLESEDFNGMAKRDLLKILDEK